MHFKLSDVGTGKKIARIVDIQTNDQNSLTRATLLELKSILDDTHKDEKYSALIFTSTNEKFFSNGLDAANVAQTPDDKLVEEVGEIVLFFGHLLQFDKPVITEVTGYAMGGGAVITVGSDYKYMLEGKARIAFSEVLVGLPLPGSFVDKIARTVEGRYLNEICAGENYKAAAAKTIGLVDDIAPDIEALRKLTLKKLDYLNRIPLSALMRTKQAINAPILERFEATLKHTHASFTTPVIVKNFREAMKALAEKRRPQYID
ncbi:MAG: enoyl-CoA hydratase/isomerase family protein [Spirochaetes bacterium]|nr:enoyl-CoA hydratase/isomerase family protein [Spirochaetota bacterium]